MNQEIENLFTGFFAITSLILMETQSESGAGVMADM